MRTPGEPSDETLILACRRGDAAAWETLVARYQRLVYTVPRRAGLDDDRAADVFQQVFAILVEQIGRIEQPDRLAAWLVTTARRETWRIARRETVARAHGRDEDAEERALAVADAGPLPDELLLRLEEQHIVRLAVEGLDERCRTLLLLLFYRPDPPPYAAIAATIGVPEGSIGPTRARCLAKLRRALASSGW